MPRFQLRSKDEIEITSRAGARTVYLGDHAAICRTLDAYLLYVDTRDSGIVPHLTLDGFWESWVTLAVSRLVRPGMRVVNVGASFGYYAVLFADLVGPMGEVVAFEPVDAIADQLEKTKAVNRFSHLCVRREVVLDRRGRVPFATEPDYLNGYVAGPRAPVGQSLGELTCAPLDEMVDGRVDLLFIDAEGVEPEVLAGAAGLLAHSPDLIVVLEFTRKRYASAVEFANLVGRGGNSSLSVIGEFGELVPRTPEQLAAGDTTRIPKHWGENPMVVARP